MYKIEEVKEKALEAIRTNKLFFIEDVIAYVPCCRTSFYDKFKLNQDQDILEALEKNKIELKVSMRSKWYKSDHPALQLGLYKLIGTDAEADRLGNKQKVEFEDKTVEVVKTIIGGKN